MTLCIKNARLVEKAISPPTDVLVQNGRIASIGKQRTLPKDTHSIDGTDCIIMPGVFDLKASLNPHMDAKKQSMGFLSAGVTEFCHPPDFDPCIDDVPHLDYLRQFLQTSPLHPTVHPISALTKDEANDELSNCLSLDDAGCAGFSGTAKLNPRMLSLALTYAKATHQRPVFFDCKDPHLSKDPGFHDGIVSAMLGLPSIPVTAETMPLASYLALAKSIGCSGHFYHLASKASCELLKTLGKEKHTVSVAIANLFFCEDDVESFNTKFHTSPPLRAKEDQKALIDGLKSGLIDCICSNHYPIDIEEKMVPLEASGNRGYTVDALLPLALKLVEDSTLTITEVVEKVCINPRKIVGTYPKEGMLQEGQEANFCIVHTNNPWQKQDRRSLAHKMHFRHRLTHTLLQGDVAYPCQV